ncbi:MAG: nitroreductase family protein [Saprospiraceae bacterium]|nr:nitroreductase family protein [Saprospiraceae bacterium]
MSTFLPYHPPQFEASEMLQRSRDFYQEMNTRRTLRMFSDKPVPRELIEHLLMTAGTAPSGAHKQPWIFCAVGDPQIKAQIREAAEKEEYVNYHGRMSEEWLQDLEPFGTDWHKPFLETAPWLLVVFKKSYDLEGEDKKKNYYVNESVGIACGFLLAAIHHAGLAALTHTPSPMNFLQQILGRPDNERPFLLIPVGYPADDAVVPDIRRKTAEEFIIWRE